MRTIAVVLLLIFTTMNTFSQQDGTDRKPVAAGTFYPADKDKLLNDLTAMFASCKKPNQDGKVRAVIAPHAGYVFSGTVAASAYSAIPKDATYKNIFIIGSSHVMYFDGAALYTGGDYITPLGKAVVNKEITNQLLLNNKVFGFPNTAHIKEHSIEVQLPFLQYYFRNTPPVIPIIIGSDNVSTVRKVAEALLPYFTPDNLFVISSDFSHYPAYDDAVEADKVSSEGLMSNNPRTFISALKSNSAKQIPGLATSMCGWTSGLTLLYMSEGNKNLHIKLVDYKNSGDSGLGGKDEVVGYNALVMYDKGDDDAKISDEQLSLKLSNEEKRTLFTIARKSILAKLNSTQYEADEKHITDNLRRPYGAFVTLKENGALRGCIGRFITTESLYDVIHESALSSAFDDPRFSAVKKEEYDDLEIEITVLGSLKKIKSPDEIILGKHGIYIRKGMQSGTMLPQVATENGWTVEQFLGYTSRDKAGLGWDGWKNAELFIYEGLVLEENK